MPNMHKPIVVQNQTKKSSGGGLLGSLAKAAAGFFGGPTAAAGVKFVEALLSGDTDVIEAASELGVALGSGEDTDTDTSTETDVSTDNITEASKDPGDADLTGGVELGQTNQNITTPEKPDTVVPQGMGVENQGFQGLSDEEVFGAIYNAFMDNQQGPQPQPGGGTPFPGTPMNYFIPFQSQFNQPSFQQQPGFGFNFQRSNF